MKRIEPIYAMLAVSIAGWREHRGLSQALLAKRLRRTRAWVCNLENARNRVMLHDIPRIAKALHCRVNELMPPEWFDLPP